MRGLIMPTVVVLFALTKGSLAMDVSKITEVGARIPTPPFTGSVLVRNENTPKGMLFATLNTRKIR